MPRYKVTRLDEVTLVEFEGIVGTRHYRWLGAVDALLLRGHRTLVVSFEHAQLENPRDALLVRAIAANVLEQDGRVVFVPPTGLLAAARVRSMARRSHVLAARTVACAVAAVRDYDGPPASLRR
jgi:hypothetical protein